MKNGKKKVVGILFVLLLIILIGCIAAYAYIVTDIFKTPRQLFGKYLKNQVEQISNANFKPFDEVFAKANDSEIDWNLELELPEDALEMFEDNIAKVNVSLKSDTTNQKSMISIDANIGETEFANYDMIYSNNTMGVKIPEINEKYLALENRDLKKFAKSIGLDDESINEMPDKIEMLENTELTEEEIAKIEAIKERYSAKIAEQIPDEKFSVEKDVALEMNNTNYVVNKYAITLTVEETSNIFKNLLNDFVNDEDIIYFYEKAGSKDKLEELKKDLEENVEEIDSEKKLELVQLALYVKEGSTLKTQLLVGNYVEANLNVNNTLENESTIAFYIDTQKQDEYSVGSQTSILINNKYENNQGNFKADMKTSYNKDDVKALKKAFDDDSDYYDELYKAENSSVTLTTTVNDENNLSTKISIKGIENEEDIKIKNNVITFKLNTTPKIEELSDKNAIIVNDYSEEDFNALSEELLENLEKSYSENPNTFVCSMYSIINAFSSSLSNAFTSMDSNVNIEDTTTKNLIEDVSDITSEISTSITLSLIECLKEYKTASFSDADADLSEYLTIEKIEKNCSNSKIENILLVDGTTLTCEYNGNLYYIKVDVNADDLQVKDVQTYTEEEYLNL